MNAWLPAGVRTGLVPVEIRLHGRPISAPGTVRIIPAGPMIPRIISVTDGVNLVETNVTTSGLVKIQLEEMSAPGSVGVTIDGRPAAWLEIKCVDPRAPRHEVNLGLPEGLAAGRHLLEIHAGRWKLPAEIDFRPRSS